MIRVVLADDHRLMRSSLAALIDAEPDLAVVGQATTGVEAIELATSTRPHLVLMDIRMPELDGLAATREICRRAPAGGAPPRVLVLTMFELDEYVYEAVRAGASGFLLKDTSPDALLAGVRSVHAGESLLSAGLLRRLIEQVGHTAGPSVDLERARRELTPREIEVLTLVARGLSNAELAHHLVISRATVKSHITHLLAKLAARDRAQLVIAGYELGLVRPGADAADQQTDGQR